MMEIDVSGDQITLDKELNDLDKLAIDFVRILDSSGIRYVLVSGYVAILFGRSRSSEDIDVMVEKMSEEQFLELSDKITKSFDCIITDNPKSAYEKTTCPSGRRSGSPGRESSCPTWNSCFPRRRAWTTGCLKTGSE